MPGDGNAVGVFHDEERCTIGRGPAIEQTCDVGMTEVRQNLALGPESAFQLRVSESAANQLDRDLRTVRFVGTLGEPDGAHSAVPQFPHKTVRSELQPRAAGSLGECARRTGDGIVQEPGCDVIAGT